MVKTTTTTTKSLKITTTTTTTTTDVTVYLPENKTAPYLGVAQLLMLYIELV